jgi:hypothetical protein
MKALSPAAKARGFRIHALVFVVAMPLLAVITLLTLPFSLLWVPWVLPSWGIGLLSHWWFVLGPGARGTGNGDAGRQGENR